MSSIRLLLLETIGVNMENIDNQYPNLGRYLRRFCALHGIKKTDFARSLGYNPKYDIWNIKSMSLNRYFHTCEYMSTIAKMPISFYEHRLKIVIQGDYIWDR